MSRNEHPIMAALRRQHPSDRLLNGQVESFAEALELLEAEHAYERDLLLRSEPDQADVARMDAAHAQIRAATGVARRAWSDEQEAARLRTTLRLRSAALAAEAALDDEASRWLGLLADGLEQGDYSGLAI